MTPPGGEPGVLSACITGPAARHYNTVSEVERRMCFINGLVKRFGPEAATPFFYKDFDWTTEKWSRGEPFSPLVALHL